MTEVHESSSNPCVVLGASGTMGGCAVESLLARSARVRVLVRSPERVAHLPPCVERVVGDASRPDDLLRVLEGARSVFFVSPHAPDEERLAANVVEASARAGVRLVFAGVHIDGRSRVSRAIVRTMIGLRFPHYRGKTRAAERVRRAEGSIVLMPSNFCQNDELFRDAILGGTLPEPLGAKGTNRVDVRDVGDAAAVAMLAETFAPGAYPVCGPASLTGPECAAVWSAALGREVRYTGDGDDWRLHVERSLEGRKRDDFLATFPLLRDYEVATDPVALAATTALLGRAPRSYADYVRDTLARWRADEAAS